jgi:hypothetical protein
MAGNDGTLLMEGAQIIFRNFSGREGMYNAEGDRNFCVLLDDELADKLRQDDWNIKELKAREEGDSPQQYIQVSVKYRGRTGTKVRPPKIWMITSKGRTPLDEDLVEFLDYVDIANVDLIIRPFQWAVNGKTGVKAYLQTLYITIIEDALEMKYRDVPELRAGPKAIGTGHDEDDDIWDAEVVDDDVKAIER